MAPARTVVVPYLDTVERLLFVLSNFEQGTTSRTSLDYFEGPVAWWLTRGVVRVIFLQQAGPDDTPPLRIADPDGPIDEPPVRRRIRPEDAPFKEVQASRLATHLSAPHGPPVEGLTSASPTSREGERGASIAASGSYLQLEWGNSSRTAWRRGIGFSCPTFIQLSISPENGFCRTLRRPSACLEMTGSNSRRRLQRRYAPSQAPRDWSTYTAGILLGDTTLFPCRFILGHWRSDTFRAAAVMSRRDIGALHWRNPPLAGISGSRTASAG